MHRKYLIFCLLALLSLTISLPSCAPKYGCPSVETAKTNRKGELKSKKGKSELFPKSMRKKMKKH